MSEDQAKEVQSLASKALLKEIERDFYEKLGQGSEYGHCRGCKHWWRHKGITERGEVWSSCFHPNATFYTKDCTPNHLLQVYGGSGRSPQGITTCNSFGCVMWEPKEEK